MHTPCGRQKAAAGFNSGEGLPTLHQHRAGGISCTEVV